MKDLWQPVADKLTEINNTLQQVTQTAKASQEMVVASQANSRHFYQFESWARDRFLLIENTQKARSCKFRGIPEGEGRRLWYLPVFVLLVLGNCITWEEHEKTVPAILRAQRLVTKRNPHLKGPSDILIEPQGERSKRKIFNEARSQKALPYKDLKISVFQDLPVEALEKKKSFKTINNKTQWCQDLL